MADGNPVELAVLHVPDMPVENDTRGVLSIDGCQQVV